MSSGGANQTDLVEAAAGERRRSSLVYASHGDPKGPGPEEGSDTSDDDTLVGPNGEQYPTADEKEKLRRVCGRVPWTAYTIAFVELCERFSYYGTTIVCMSGSSPIGHGLC
jgi:proton-dependent oligopeptide transporter, POT family